MKANILIIGALFAIDVLAVRATITYATDGIDRVEQEGQLVAIKAVSSAGVATEWSMRLGRNSFLCSLIQARPQQYALPEEKMNAAFGLFAVINRAARDCFSSFDSGNMPHMIASAQHHNGSAALSGEAIGSLDLTSNGHIRRALLDWRRARNNGHITLSWHSTRAEDDHTQAASSANDAFRARLNAQSIANAQNSEVQEVKEFKEMCEGSLEFMSHIDELSRRASENPGACDFHRVQVPLAESQALLDEMRGWSDEQTRSFYGFCCEKYSGQVIVRPFRHIRG